MNRTPGQPPDYEGLQWDAREERLRQWLEDLVDRKLELVLERIRRLEQEGDDAADQGD